MPMLLFHLFRLFRTGGGTEQNKVDVFADRYVCSAPVTGEGGQSLLCEVRGITSEPVLITPSVYLEPWAFYISEYIL